VTTYEEWRAIGSIGGEPYEFTWSPQRNPHLGDPQAAARKFVKAFRDVGIDVESELRLEHRTVTVTEWQAEA
jgi:hypothetical protein